MSKTVTQQNGWKEEHLRKVGQIITGKTPSQKNPEDWGSEILFVTPTDYKNYRKFACSSERELSQSGCDRLKNKILPSNSIMVTCIGSDMGKVAINKSPVITNQQINSIVPNQEIVNPDFLYYRLVDMYDLLRVFGTAGTAVPIVNKKDFENIDIYLPPLPEQKAIAVVLSSLDDKIDLLHRQNKTLEDMAQTLFRKWFVEEANHFKSDKFKLWVKDTIGGEWGKEEVTDDFNVPAYCIRGTDIADLNLGLPKKIPIRYIQQKKLESIKPNDGAIIIEISGGTDNQSTGRTTYINKYVKSLFELPLIFSNFCRMLRVKKKEYTFFVYCYLQYLYDQEEYFNLESGSSGIRNLNYKALLFEIDYPMPNKRNVLNFDKQVKDYFIKINKNKSQIRTLENLRDTLLPKLISGVVRIKL
jgi:type I restriction enzyme S subunit